MDWYWWVLIGVGAVAIGVAKWWFGKQWLANRKKQAEIREKNQKEDE